MTGTERIKVLIADDHPVVRAGLVAVLSLAPDLDIVAEASTVDEAVRLAESVDVVLMDLQFGSEVQGIAGTRRVRELPSPPHVLVLTTYDNESDVLAATEAGASGYLLKDASPDELASAIRAAVRGETVVAPSIAQRLVRRTLDPRASLSARELEVLDLVAQGLPNADIARQLFLSQATVKTHLVHVFDKLDVDSRTAAVAVARERGLIR